MSAGYPYSVVYVNIRKSAYDYAIGETKDTLKAIMREKEVCKYMCVSRMRVFLLWRWCVC